MAYPLDLRLPELFVVPPLSDMFALLPLLPLLAALPLSSAISGLLTDPTIVDNQSFDYVIIGAGLGGMVVANRLSENPDVTVLLVRLSSGPTVWGGTDSMVKRH